MQARLLIWEDQFLFYVGIEVCKQMASRHTYMAEKCQSYLIVHGEAALGNGFRAFLYLLGLAYCFIGLSAITARFFRSMENVVKQTRKVVEIDPQTKSVLIKEEKVWNYTIADITLLAFGTSFPQISLAIIDAIQNIGQLDAGGLHSFLREKLISVCLYVFLMNDDLTIIPTYLCSFLVGNNNQNIIHIVSFSFLNKIHFKKKKKPIRISILLVCKLLVVSKPYWVNHVL